MFKDNGSAPGGYGSEGVHFQLFVSGNGPSLTPLYQSYNAARVNHLTGTSSSEGSSIGYSGHQVLGYCSTDSTSETPNLLVRLYSNSKKDHYATTNPGGELGGDPSYTQGGNLCWVP